MILHNKALRAHIATMVVTSLLFGVLGTLGPGAQATGMAWALAPWYVHLLAGLGFGSVSWCGWLLYYTFRARTETERSARER